MMTGIFVDSFFNSLIHFYRKWGCLAMQAWMANNIIFQQLQKNITGEILVLLLKNAFFHLYIFHL